VILCGVGCMVSVVWWFHVGGLSGDSWGFNVGCLVVQCGLSVVLGLYVGCLVIPCGLSGVK
jgi:hypothetical protein